MDCDVTYNNSSTTKTLWFDSHLANRYKVIVMGISYVSDDMHLRNEVGC